MRKNQDFLHNCEKIAIAHQCKMLSKFRAISTRNVRKSKNFDWKPFISSFFTTLFTLFINISAYGLIQQIEQ